MLPRTILAIGIAAWTLLSWGGRIRLLTEAEQDVGNWLRIGGSLLIGAAAVAVLFIVDRTGWERWVLTVFAAWSTVIWLRSVVSVWSGDQSLPFKAVHTILALGFFFLSYQAIRVGWGSNG